MQNPKEWFAQGRARVDINHGFIERVTYVIGKDHKIVATLSSKDDKLSPDQHVERALAIVQQMESK